MPIMRKMNLVNVQFWTYLELAEDNKEHVIINWSNHGYSFVQLQSKHNNFIEFS